MAKQRENHGLTKHPLYQPWAQMKYRCDNPNHIDYHRYGARGITYDSKWQDFTEFLSDMEPSWVRGLTLDRIDVNGNYCKKNCRWADRKVQAINRRNTKLFEYKGKKLTLTDWATELGVKRSTLSMRYYAYNWPIEKVLLTQ